MFKSYYDMFNNPFAPHPKLYECVEYQPIYTVSIEKSADISKKIEEPVKQKEPVSEQKVDNPKENSNLPVLNDVQYHVETTERKKPFWRK